MSFEEWMKKVDEALIERCGLTSSDLADWHYYDDYENGVNPKRAAARAFKNAIEF